MLKEFCVALFAPRKFRYLRRVCAISLVALIAGTSITRAEDPDEAYLTIYNLVQEGDALSAKGSNQQALDKYRAAQVALKRFELYHAAWKPKLIAAREKYLGDRVTALTAPGAAAASSSASASQGQAQQRSGTSEKIKLLSAGAEPHQVLRLHPKAGDKQTCVTTMKIAMGTQMGEIKLPAIILTMDTTVKSVSAEGDIAYDVVMADAKTTDDDTSLPQVEALKSSIAKLKGMSGTGMVSSRGIKKGAQMKVPEGTDPQIRQVMEPMIEALSEVSADLPEEPVGPGAKWESKERTKSGGVSINQTSVYELVSLEGDKLVVKGTLTEQASNQKVQNGGMSADMTRLAGTGSAEATMDLSKIFPLQLTMDDEREMVMAVNAGGQKQEMTMKLKVKFEIETK